MGGVNSGILKVNQGFSVTFLAGSKRSHLVITRGNYVTCQVHNAEIKFQELPPILVQYEETILVQG